MWDDSTKNYVEFRYYTCDEDGERLVNISRRVVGDDTKFLPNILLEFMYFLHGMTFSYVDEITAECSGGKTISSADRDTFDVDEEEED